METDGWGAAPGSPFWWWSPSVSVVVVSHNEGANLRRTVHNHLATLPANSEIVVVDDVSDDGSVDFLAGGYPGVRVVRPAERLGVSSARNLGGETARGDVVVFSDAHMDLPPAWLEPLVVALGEPDVGMVGPAIVDVHGRGMIGCGMTIADPESLELAWLERDGTQPRAVPVLCGMFTAMRRDVFRAVGGFDPGMQQWGDEDLELSMRLWLLGYRVLAVPEVVVGHLFRDTFPYTVDTVEIVANRIRLGVLHLDGARLERYLGRLESQWGFDHALKRARSRGLEQSADRLRSVRRHGADWFIEEVAGHRAA